MALQIVSRKATFQIAVGDAMFTVRRMAKEEEGAIFEAEYRAGGKNDAVAYTLAYMRRAIVGWTGIELDGQALPYSAEAVDQIPSEILAGMKLILDRGGHPVPLPIRLEANAPRSSDGSTGSAQTTA